MTMNLRSPECSVGIRQKITECGPATLFQTMVAPIRQLVAPHTPEPRCSGSPHREVHALVREKGRWPYLRCKRCGAILNSQTERWVASVRV